MWQTSLIRWKPTATCLLIKIIKLHIIQDDSLNEPRAAFICNSSCSGVFVTVVAAVFCIEDELIQGRCWIRVVLRSLAFMGSVSQNRSLLHSVCPWMESISTQCEATWMKIRPFAPADWICTGSRRSWWQRPTDSSRNNRYGQWESCVFQLIDALQPFCGIRIVVVQSEHKHYGVFNHYNKVLQKYNKKKQALLILTLRRTFCDNSKYAWRVCYYTALRDTQHLSSPWQSVCPALLPFTEL